MVRAFLAMGAALVLAGCETTSAGLSAGQASPSGAPGMFSQTQHSRFGDDGIATSTSAIDPATGQRVVTGGSFSIGSGNVAMAGAMIGSWTLGDDFARRCSLSLTTAPLAGGNGAMEAKPSGFCSSEFSSVAGWMAAGSGIALTDNSGRIQGQLVSDNRGGFTGTFNTAFGPNAVKLTRGGF